MFRNQLKMLMNEYGVKQEAIISTINSNRVTFAKKMADNSFTAGEVILIMQKYGSLLR